MAQVTSLNTMRISNKFAHYLLWGLVGLLFLPNFLQLYTSRWSALGYTHAYFILPVCLWIVFRKRKDLVQAFSQTKERFMPWPLAIFVFGVLMYIFGWPMVQVPRDDFGDFKEIN